MARTRLTVLQPFRADKEKYNIGDEVPMKVAQSWSDGTLDRRIRSKFLRVDVNKTEEELEAEAGVNEAENLTANDLLGGKGEDHEYTEEELNERTKDELMKIGSARGLNLKESQTKAEMVEAILLGEDEDHKYTEAELTSRTKAELAILGTGMGLTGDEALDPDKLTKDEMVKAVQKAQKKHKA